MTLGTMSDKTVSTLTSSVFRVFTEMWFKALTLVH